MIFYEIFINNSPIVGMTIGRVIASVYVNKGRFNCIILGSVVIIFGISLCLIFDIWCFIFGRILCVIGCGLYYTAASRYIEECSPPHLLSLIFTAHSFTLTLNRPFGTMMAYLTLPIIDETTPKDILLKTN
jgi:MFS family permease